MNNRMLSRVGNEAAHPFPKSQLNYSLVAMLMIIAVLGIVSIFWGEQISINGCFGWDGQTYGTIAQNMNVRSLDTYSIQRILPCVIVHFALVVLHKPLDNQHVVLAFSRLNLGLLLLSCVLYRCIAEELDLRQSGFWLGFIGIFVNFANFKFVWYDPVLTNVTATAFSLAMLLFYLRRQQLALVIVALLGAYTWPTLIYVGALLLLFPLYPIMERKTRQPRYIAAGLAGLVFIGVIYICYIRHLRGYTNQVNLPGVALPLSLVLCVLYVYLASSTLLHGISARTILTSLSPRHAATAAMLFVASKIPAYLLADHSKPAINMRFTIAVTLVHSVVRPLGFLVSHPVFWGPVFLLFLFYWKPFTAIIRNYGLGLTLVIFIGVFMSINTESRQNTSSYIIAVPFLALLVERLALPAWFFWLMGAMALASSKVWMRMGLPAYDTGQYLLFPLQNFFMSQGPWMNNRMFALQGVIVLVTAALLYAYLRSRRQHTAL